MLHQQKVSIRRSPHFVCTVQASHISRMFPPLSFFTSENYETFFCFILSVQKLKGGVEKIYETERLLLSRCIVYYVVRLVTLMCRTNSEKGSPKRLDPAHNKMILVIESENITDCCTLSSSCTHAIQKYRSTQVPTYLLKVSV